MTTSLDPAETLMRLQAMVNSRMRNLSIELAERSDIKATIRECAVDRYDQQDKTIFSVCVDVETSRDIAVSFSFEFSCENQRWSVGALIAQRFREGMHTLEDCPDSFPTSLEELEVTTMRAIDWLGERARVFNFASLRNAG